MSGYKTLLVLATLALQACTSQYEDTPVSPHNNPGPLDITSGAGQPVELGRVCTYFTDGNNELDTGSCMIEQQLVGSFCSCSTPFGQQSGTVQ